jgi:hypothetical protein
MIVEEVQSRWTGSCSFDEFCEWWNKHRYLLETWSSPFDYSPNQAPLTTEVGLSITAFDAGFSRIRLS